MSKRKVFPVLILVFIFVFILISAPEKIQNETVSVLKLCALRVIPSLFPFFVVNELIIQTGIDESLGKVFGKFFGKLFSISSVSATVFILGLIGGFPLGAKSAVSLYNHGKISKKEAEKLIYFCNNTGPGFIFGFCSFFTGGNISAFSIYAGQILTAVFFGMIIKSIPSEKDCEIETKQNTDIFSCLSSSIQSSVLPILNVCSFVLFFGVVSSCLNSVSLYRELPSPLKTFIFGILEITKGISLLTPVYKNGVADYLFPTFICGIFVGFGGLSVAFQTLSVSDKINIKFSKYIAIKMLFGLVCGLFSVCFFKIFQYIL